MGARVTRPFEGAKQAAGAWQVPVPGGIATCLQPATASHESAVHTLWSSQSSGPAQSAKAPRSYLINIIGVVSNSELRLDWTFSKSIHREETIERLAHSFVAELRNLITDASDKVAYSPSDFPSAQVSQEELNKVLAKLRG